MKKKRKLKIGFTAMIAVIMTLALAACSNPAGGGGGGGNGVTSPPPPYIITGSDASFTAAHENGTQKAVGLPIQDVINAIREDAGGHPVTIKFGDDGQLNIGSVQVNFTGTWGHITLEGSILSSATSSTILVSGANSITSTAIIENNSSGMAIQHSSTGTVAINGGRVQSTSATAITINNGGTALNITGGLITSATQSSNGTIYLNSANARLYMSGGTVRTTSGFANTSVINMSYAHEDGIVITGGTVASMNSSEVISISVAIRNSTNRDISISGSTTHIVSSANNVGSNPGTINLASGSGNLTVSDGAKVENTHTLGRPAIFKNDSHTGTVNVSGGNIIPPYEP